MYATETPNREMTPAERLNEASKRVGITLNEHHSAIQEVYEIRQRLAEAERVATSTQAEFEDAQRTYRDTLSSFGLVLDVPKAVTFEPRR